MNANAEIPTHDLCSTYPYDFRHSQLDWESLSMPQRLYICFGDTITGYIANGVLI
ncbi:hypothetical protein MTBPR1_40162 [Candidatus Terasakiella magnetica]|uniref:Uncharacterized protein n=1 Tax=Candidatus Terasakiella magnetica TaxID=1867952 RepID=A0A1C3RIQ1_9PROT|nr:hypothetical protein MTBPR1_40162 [Candidatus Terasakiella magnetica]